MLVALIAAEFAMFCIAIWDLETWWGIWRLCRESYQMGLGAEEWCRLVKFTILC